MPGERFGPYELLSLIGRGGMGEVHRAVDTRKNRGEVALKRLPAGLAADPDFQRRFLREAELAARLRDPHVIPIHDYGEIDGQPYLDMRLVDGTDLASHLARNGPLDPSRAVDLVAQVAGALDAAHAEGLVHRDVKPHNILLAGGGGPDFAYLIDFGIAANLLTNSRSSSMVSGTAAYMAPERFGAGGDHRVDVYALGCVLHELLTGRTPFTGDFLQLLHAHVHEPPPRPSSLRPDLPRVLDDVVTTAMAKDPDRRFASAGALAAATRGADRPVAVSTQQPAAGRPPVALPPPAAPPPQPPPRRGFDFGALEAAGKRRKRRRTVALVAAAVAAAVAVVATVVAVVSRPTATDDLAAAGFVTHLAVAADGRHALVTRSAPEVALVDLPTGTPTSTTPMPGYADGAALSTDGSRAYVIGSRSASDSTGGWLRIVDTARHVVVGEVPIASPQSVAAGADGRVYVSSWNRAEGGEDGVVVVDAASATVAATVPLAVPGDLRATPDGRRVYVTAVGGTSVIDTATDTVVATIPAPGGTTALALQVSHDGRSAYVAYAGDPSATSAVVERIDVATNGTQTGTVSGKCPGCEIAVSDDDRTLYVLSSGPGRSDDPTSRLTTLDPTTLQAGDSYAFDEYALGDGLAVVGGSGDRRAYFPLGYGLHSLAV